MKKPIFLFMTIMLLFVSHSIFAQRRIPLNIETNVSGAMVHIDGSRAGTTRPDFSTGLRAGDYQIKITMDGYEPFETSITVGSSPINLKVELQRVGAAKAAPAPQPEPAPAPAPAPAPTPVATPAAPRAGEIPVTFYWHAADTSDIYINGVPIKNFSPDYKTRRDEAPRDPFSAAGSIKEGDVITVGTRRGGSYGFMMVALDRSGKVILRTDESWSWYEPPGNINWFEPRAYENANRRGPVLINPTPWGKQNQMRQEYGDDVLSVYTSNFREPHTNLYYKVSLTDTAAPQTARATQPAAQPEPAPQPTTEVQPDPQPAAASGELQIIDGFVLGKYHYGLNTRQHFLGPSFIFDFKADGTFQVEKIGSIWFDLPDTGRWSKVDDLFNPFANSQDTGILLDFSDASGVSSVFGGGMFGSPWKVIQLFKRSDRNYSYYLHIAGEGNLVLEKKADWDLTGEWLTEAGNAGFKLNSDGTAERLSMGSWTPDGEWSVVGMNITRRASGRTPSSVRLFLTDVGKARILDHRGNVGSTEYIHKR